MGSKKYKRALLCPGCLQKASNAVSGPCQSFVGLQSSLPPGNATDAQLQAVLNKSSPPSQRWTFSRPFDSLSLFPVLRFVYELSYCEAKCLSPGKHNSCCSCCVEAGDLVTNSCQCDATVQQFSGLYDLTPTNLITCKKRKPPARHFRAALCKLSQAKCLAGIRI